MWYSADWWDLTTMWCSADWWNLTTMWCSADWWDLTTMWCSADWWNPWWFEHDSSVQMNVICLIWLQPISLFITERAPWRILKVWSESTSLLFCCYVLARGTNMVAAFKAFHMEYYLWRSEWSQFSAQVSGSLEPSVVAFNFSFFKPVYVRYWSVLDCVTLNIRSQLSKLARLRSGEVMTKSFKDLTLNSIQVLTLKFYSTLWMWISVQLLNGLRTLWVYPCKTFQRPWLYFNAMAASDGGNWKLRIFLNPCLVSKVVF